MVALLGPLPTVFKKSWPRYGKYFNEEDVQEIFDVDCVPSLGSLDNLSEHGELDTEDINPPESCEDVDKAIPDDPRMCPRYENEMSIQDLYPSLIEVCQSDESPLYKILIRPMAPRQALRYHIGGAGSRCRPAEEDFSI